MDRGYAKFTLWNDIHAANSSYVCRVRDNSVYEVIEEKQPTEADRKAGVISDQIVKIGASKADDQAERCRNPDVHRNHRVLVDSDSHRPRADEADL